MKILVLLKQRLGYGYGSGFSSGLANSAEFAVDMLRAEGFKAKLVEVVDANDIDREVTSYRPDVVIIEALWVTPKKFIELSKLHRRVRWVVRYHSELAFLGSESVALRWLSEYAAIPSVFVAPNTRRGQKDFISILGFQTAPAGKVLLLPTYYPVPQHIPSPRRRSPHEIHIICPGAIRPLKNHLNQALAAMLYATEHNLRLHFYVNGDRMEQGGEAIWKNLKAMFHGTRHQLISLPWKDHDAFLAELKEMDAAMQVSFTETFNICAADAVSVGLPIVASDAVSWISSHAKAEVNSPRDIRATLDNVLGYPVTISAENVKRLRQAASDAIRAWLGALNSI